MKPQWIVLGLLCAMTTAEAAIPTKDAAILDRKSDTARNTTKSKELLDSVKKSNQGINCSYRTPQKGRATDGRQTPDKAGGERKVGQATSATRPSASGSGSVGGSTGGTGTVTGSPGASAGNMLWNNSSTVMGGVDAGEAAIRTNNSTYQTLSGMVGKGGTMQEAFDLNSTIRNQNGLTLNAIIQAMNLYVQAINLRNLMKASDISRISETMGSGGQGSGQGDPTTRPVHVVVAPCQPSHVGSGTESAPCRADPCGPSAAGGNACVTPRYADTAGQVITYMAMQPGNEVTADELSAAVRAYQSAAK